jgi:two-component system cell cycle sensor histidine kinase/response regulator CckA
MTKKRRKKEKKGKTQDKVLDCFSIIKEINTAGCFLDPKGNFLFSNQACDVLFGVKNGKLVNRNLKEFVSPKTLKTITKKRKKEADNVHELEISLGHKKKKFIIFDSSPEYDDNGKFIGFLVFIEDITEYKRKEEDLLLKCSLLDSLLENLPDPIYFKDRNSRFIRVNKAKALKAGKDEEFFIGKTDFDFFPKDQAKEMMKDEKKILEKGKKIIEKEQKVTRAGGKEEWTLATKVPRYGRDGKIIGTLGISRDITAEKILKEKLKERVEVLGEEVVFKSNLLTSLLDNIPDLIYFKDRKSRFVELSKSKANQVGLPKEKVLGKTDFDYFTEEHAEQAYKDEQKIIKTGKPIEGKTEKETHPDGKITWVSTTKIPRYDKKGKIIGTLGISRDVTEKIKLEEKLKEHLDQLGEEVVFKSNLLTSLLGNIPDLIYFKDRKSRFVELSKSKANQVGLPKGEVIGKTDFDYFTKEHAEQAYKDEQKIIKTGKPIEGKIEKETHPDGRVTWVSTTKIPSYDEKGNIVGTLGISRDVTLQKKTEEQLKENEARTRAILSALPDLLFQIKKDGTVISYYVAKKDILSVKPEDFMNKNVKDVLPISLASQCIESIKRAIRTKETVSFEYQVPVKGELRDREARVARSDENTAILVIRDISEMKKAQKEIARLNDLIEQSSDAIIRMDTEMNINYANEATKKMFGYPFSEIKGKTLSFLIAEADSEKIQRDIFEEISGGKIYSGEHLNIKKDGSVFSCLMRIMPLLDKNGKTYGYMGSLMDISEEKEARDELVFRKNLLDSLLELTPDEIFFKDTDCRFLEVSESKAKKFAVAKEEIIGKSDFSFLEEEIAGKYFKEEQNLMNNMNPLLDKEEKIVDPDGKFHWISYSKVPRYDKEGNVIGLIGISRDITKLKKIEEELRKEEELLSNALESMEDGILVLDKNFHFTYWNSSMEKISKVSRDKVLNSGKTPWEIFPNLKTTKVDEMMKKAMNGEVVKRERIPYESEDRKKFFTSEMYLPLRNPEGDIYGIVGVVKEVTKEIKAEETLKESEEKYRILVESSKDGICICRDDKFLFVNDRLCEILRYDKEELYNTEIWQIINEDDRNIIKEMERRREKGEEIPDVYEANIVTKDGDILFSEFSVRKITYQGFESFMIIIRDITEYKDMEKEREKADRLESLGILAGGIAHDFNNFLTGILGNISLAKLHLSPEDEAYDILRESEKAAQSAKSLTQQLLTFSKGGAPVKVNIDIEDTIKSSANFVLSGSNVKCNFELPGNLWNVKADRGQLTQIFNNLILNAVQSMPEGGIIRIRGENLNIDKNNNLPLKNGKYVMIGIHDRGIGIPPEILPKIFDPFFTTKQKGSGLGLSTVFSIIKRHEGHITVESNMGEGTSFYIYLPATLKATIDEKKKEKKSLKGKGKILIMDDKSFVRNAAVKALTLFGYKVKGSTDGDEAVSLYKEALNEGKPFDVVILDLTIPGGMGGEDTLKKLREVNPKVKAIVSSGYSEDPVMSEYKKHGFNAIVSKPYQYEDLCEVIRKVIEEDS